MDSLWFGREEQPYSPDSMVVHKTIDVNETDSSRGQTGALKLCICSDVIAFQHISTYTGILFEHDIKEFVMDSKHVRLNNVCEGGAGFVFVAVIIVPVRAR